MPTTIIHISRPKKGDQSDSNNKLKKDGANKAQLPYYPLIASRLPCPTFINPGLARAGLSTSEPDVIVSLHAAALNHRDLFIRQNLYPGISDEAALCGDGAGIVAKILPSTPNAGSPAPQYSSLLGKRVVICPGHNWVSRLSGPESGSSALSSGPYSIMGGTSSSPFHGTLGTSVRVPASHVVPAPNHLSAAQAASLPIAGLTAWRAVVTKLQSLEQEAASEANGNGGKLRILITGIGGGVALFALQFAVARGHDVWVTSSSQQKIDQAVKVGASGGEKYTATGWENGLLKKVAAKIKNSHGADDGTSSLVEFDALIDSAGGPTLIRSASKLLRHGGVIVQYGITVPPHSIQWNMSAVLKNIELRGCTMGSAKEFKDMVEFVAEKRLIPIVGEVLHVMEGHEVGTGGDNYEEEERIVGDALTKAVPRIDTLFERMKQGTQFGKLVIQIREPEKWAKYATRNTTASRL